MWGVGFGVFFGLDLRVGFVWFFFGWVFLRGDSEDGD